jgi:hypothetical protein
MPATATEEKPALVLPIVHLNGTSAEELLRLRQDAHSALDKAVVALQQMAPNGRDYYLESGRFEEALAQHEWRLIALTEIMEEIAAESEEIVKFCA